MKITKHIINVLVFLFASFTIFGQTESELKENADKLFEEEQYIDVTSSYLRLLSLNPKNVDYNFRYGTCLLFNSYQKKEALRYLRYAAAQNEVDRRAYYFYGKALHLNFQFDEAIKYYQKYISKRQKKDKRYSVEREIEMCNNGKKLLSTFTDIIVSEKVEIERGKFYQMYRNMSTVGGDILVSVDFQTKLDKKNGHIPIVHYPENAQVIYYASYGETGASGKDIYMRKRLPNNKWSDAQLLPGPVNTSEDEDFPFLHSRGDILYFSSKGHNSMGGYDIFMSRLDLNTNTFKTPENIDFAISSPDDDLFYVVDSSFQNAYFASSRQSQNGKLHVFNVRVARVPIQEIIVMGDFLSEINPENKSMSVFVTDYSNGKNIGKIKTNSVGKYSFVFPQGGRYSYEVTVEGSDDIYKFMVDLPFLDKFRPLKQKAIHTTINGEELVRIVNLFDEEVEGAEAIIAEVIRKRSELDVNIDKFDLEEVDAQQRRNEVLTELGFRDMSLREVSVQLEELSITEQLKKEQVERIKANINAEILAKALQIGEIDQEISINNKAAENEIDPVKKHQFLSSQLNLETEKIQLAKEVQSLIDLKNNAKSTVKPFQNQLNAEKLEKKFKELVANEMEDDALLLLSKNKVVITKTRNESPNTIVSKLVNSSIELSTQISTLTKQQLDYQTTQDDVKNQIFLLKNSLPDANKKDAGKIRTKISDLESEEEVVQEMHTSTTKSIEKYNKKLAIVDNNISSMQKAMLVENSIAVRDNEVKEAINELEKTIENDNSQEYIDQLAIIEEEHPELSPYFDSGESNELASKTPVRLIKSKNDTEREAINKNTDLSNEDKLVALKENNDITLEDLNEDLGAVIKKIENDPSNDLLNSDKQELIAYKEKIESENVEIAEALDEIKGVTEFAMTEEQLIADVDSEYATDYSEIATNPSLSDKERLEELQILNEKLIASVIASQKKLEKSREKNPESTELKAREVMLNSLLTKKQSEVEERSQLINALSDVSSILGDDDVKENFENELKSDYSSNRERIENKDLSSYLKSKSLIELENDYLEILVGKRTEIEKDLNNKPEDIELIQALTVINEMINKQENEITQLKDSAIRSIATNELESIINDVDENFIEDVAEIGSTDGVTMNDDKANRESILQEKLTIKLEDIDKLLEKKYSVNDELERAVVEKAIIESTEREKEYRLSQETTQDTTVFNESEELEALSTIESDQKNELEELKNNEFSSITAENIKDAIDNIDKEYNADIVKIKKEGSESQKSNIVQREKELQEKISDKRTKVEKTNDKKFSSEQELEIAILNKALSESKEREVAADKSNVIASTSENDKEEYLNAFREVLTSEGDNQLTATYFSMEELEEQGRLLASYEAQITVEIESLEKEMISSNSTEAEAQINWLNEELMEVQQKRRTVNVSIGELETELIADNSSNNPTFEKIEDAQRINSKLENELETLQTKDSENEVLTQTTLVNTVKKEQINKLIFDSKQSKSEEEKSYLLEKAGIEQEQSNKLVGQSIHDVKRKDLEREFDVQLLTNEELATRKRTFSVQIGELTTEILRVDKEIGKAKKKNVPALETKNLQLIAERSLIENKLRALEEYNIKESTVASVISREAQDVTLSFNEERKTSGEEGYEEYFELATDALAIEEQITNLENELSAERLKVLQLIEDDVNTSNDEPIKLRIQRITSLEMNISKLKIDLTQKKYLANETLPTNKNLAMKMQNLALRGIKPIKAIAVATLLQLPSEGFAISNTGESTYSEANPIPVGVENPSGLVYRVQIGAFAKPIPQNLYKEFNPVSGEKIEGTNITRYMAGFFNNSVSVVEARRDIRALGYSDAFIVAYCDGEKIGFGEARKREANGSCVPKGTNELMMEVATKTATKLGLPTTREVPEVSEFSYNEAPGAVKAEVIEMIQGLFFTVQIGVFNRPISSEVIYNLDEITTVRLPNGLIRYNTGLYNSVKDALPRRTEALSRGIVGAFVVAYYQGERISLSKANKLLLELGTAILQSELEKENEVEEEIIVEESSVISTARTDTVTLQNIQSNKENERENMHRIQIVTKKQFEEFPRDVLNRYNAEGAFFYDEKDKYVKSIIYDDPDDLPRLWNFKNDIDTVYIPLSATQDFESKIISVNIEGGIIPGDLMDWLLRFGNYREISETDNGLRFMLFGIAKEDLDEISEQIRTFALEPIVVEETEFELEENE